MKSLGILLVAATCLVAQGASAHEHGSHSLFLNASCDDPMRLVRRHDLDEARLAINTENRKIILLLTDRVVALQLSDRVMAKIDRKTREAGDEDGDNMLGQIIKDAVLTTVRTALNHSAECDLRDIESADYRDGEMIITTRSGERLFSHADIDHEEVMTNFSERDAREFVKELRKRIDRGR